VSTIDQPDRERIRRDGLLGRKHTGKNNGSKNTGKNNGSKNEAEHVSPLWRQIL
jgi:hypothetical protein